MKLNMVELSTFCSQVYAYTDLSYISFKVTEIFSLLAKLDRLTIKT